MALTVDGQIDVATSNEYIYATVSGFVVAAVSGQPITISGDAVITSVSGQPVLISGQLTTYSGIGVAVQSGYGVTVQSGYGVITSISGQSVGVNISGQPVVHWNRYPILKGYEYRADVWNNSISKPNTMEMLIKTSNRVVHFEYRILSGGEASIVLYENPTVTSNGLLYGPINMNRTSSTTPVTTFYTGGKHTSGTGTRLMVDYVAVPSPSFASIPNEQEFVFKTSATYLFVANIVGTNLPIGLTAYVWEEP